MAASAFAVWYAQETRGYSLLLALTLIMAWAFVQFVLAPFWYPERNKEFRRYTPRGTLWIWIAFIASGTAALYTHYYAAFTLLALNLAFFAVVACRSQQKIIIESRITRHASRFWFSQLFIIALFIPWLPAAIRQAATNITYFPGRVGWHTVVGDTLRAFATGDVTPTTLAAWAVGVMGVLAILGALVEQPGTTRLNRVVTALLLIVPIAAMAAIAWQKPKFAPRYLIEALPAFYLLVGAGVTMLWKGAHSLASGRRGWRSGTLFALSAAGVAVLVMSGLSLRAMYFDPAQQRPDVRDVAAYIRANQQPDDIIVLLSGHQSPVFMYYYDGTTKGVPIARIPDSIMPPAQSPLDYRVARQLEDITRGQARLWLVLWQRELADPTDVVTNVLMSKAKRLGVGRDFQGMQLLLFDLRGHSPFGDGPQHAMDIHFAEPVTLAGHDLSATSCAPGETLNLALYWSASGSIAGNYQVFTHLLTPDGSLVAQSDQIAGADSYPTSLWSSGTFIRNTFALHVPPNAPSGIYRIEVGLYDARGRLKLASGADRILLTEIVVK
jgi:hypothetical protein